MRSFYIIYEEDRSDNHPTGWVKIGKASTLAKAEKFSQEYEAKHPTRFNPHSLTREYTLIEKE